MTSCLFQVGVTSYALEDPARVEGQQKSREALSGQRPGRVSSVPRKINKWLAGRRKGQRGFGLQLVSGQFEFVHDLADDSLWLVNASQLRCMRTEASAEDRPMASRRTSTSVTSTRTSSPMSFLQEKQKLDEMKRHYDRTTTMEKSRGALMHVDTMMGTLSFSLSERDVLSGMSELPQDLVKYTEAHGFMKRFYKDELFPCAESAANRSSSQTKAVGLSTWFQRWVKAHRKSLRG
ncbi:unnamed protein product [Prorocentrum cordatum]|uniref:Uncharacterized protein n=1 Tax=Prorocentrum cordatum TaxID=2364126 RepID=A0ABN9RSF0_9DINO|nr:unnamed protein product [Polarella glacialis]